MVRLVDIAREAGVSISLVSRILNSDPAVRATPATQKRVRKVASQLGYQPHYAARALRMSRTNTIAMVIPGLTNAIFERMLRGVEDEAQRLGYTLLLARSESLKEKRQVSSLVDEGRVDGFLLQGRDDETDHDLAARVGRAPVVLINSRLPTRPGSVMIDDHQAAVIATEHLIEQGHRRLALINGLQTSETARRRGLGFASATAAADIDPERVAETHLGYDPDSAQLAVRQIFGEPGADGGDRPTGVVVANVNAALAVLTEIRAHGLRVPNDVSVIAIHDAWTANHSWPPISTVRLPVYEQGSRSMIMLHDALHGGSMADVVVDSPPPDLVSRDSVARVGESPSR